MKNKFKRNNKMSKGQLLYVRSVRREKIAVNCSRVGLLAVILAIWEIAARLGWIDSFIMSSPSRIVATLAELTANGTLATHAWVSTYETLCGFLLGTTIGYVAAMVMWSNDFVKQVLEPYIVVLNSLPKIALGPILIIWMGTGKASIIAMAVLISVVITTITILNGFCATDKEKIMLMQSMGANKLQIFVKLVAPSNVPTLLNTLKINVGMAWIGSIMGEYLVSKEGLGYLLVYGSQVFRLDLVMTCTIVLCTLAGLMYAAVAMAEKLICKRFV